MEYVFPHPVAPYAMIDVFYPLSEWDTKFSVVSLYTSSYDALSNTLSNMNELVLMFFYPLSYSLIMMMLLFIT